MSEESKDTLALIASLALAGWLIWIKRDICQYKKTQSN
jgi:hypothetical protein